MANQDAAYGLRAVRHLSGGCVNTNEYTIAASYATNIFSGEPVQLVAGGGIESCAAAGGDCIGVFSGCTYVDGTGNQIFSKYWPGDANATDIKALVFDDPMIIFSIQADTDGLVAADVGILADWAVVAGDPKTGQSKTELDASTKLAASGGLRVLRLVNDGENEAGGFTDVEVLFAEHRFNTTGVGI